MSQRHAERRWYEYALAFSRAPFAVRADTSKHYRCWMLRIARLHPQIGEKLDEMKASLTVCRHVAAGDVRDVNYIHPSATITSPHRPPSLTIPRSNSLPG